MDTPLFVTNYRPFPLHFPCGQLVSATHTHFPLLLPPNFPGKHLVRIPTNSPVGRRRLPMVTPHCPAHAQRLEKHRGQRHPAFRHVPEWRNWEWVSQTPSPPPQPPAVAASAVRSAVAIVLRCARDSLQQHSLWIAADRFPFRRSEKKTEMCVFFKQHLLCAHPQVSSKFPCSHLVLYTFLTLYKTI